MIPKTHRTLSTLFILFLYSISMLAQAKSIEDFNFNWKFTLEKQQAAHQYTFDDSTWFPVRLPHDWAVALPYTNENAAASTGFKAGGIGWYRKTFNLPKSDKNKKIWVEFDGIYNNSAIWLNGHYIGGRPYGYSSFQVNLSQYANYGDKANVITVKVDRTAYADSRWYTGSGIYRNVRLVKTEPVYIPQWGMQVTTPEVSSKTAKVSINTQIIANKYQGEHAKLKIELFDQKGKKVAQDKESFDLSHENKITQTLTVKKPQLWSLETPHLYTAKATVYVDGDKTEADITTFGIRTIKFDSNKGFFLNGVNTKLKGVNLHHDAGAVGAAVHKSIWRSRLEKLKSIGVNALRLSHNPHNPGLLELADEMGFLVNAEAFDDWDRAKEKSKVHVGDNKAKGDSVISYSKHFNEWAERDLKDLVRRDFNHPSIIMWSIGNEVEWTYPYYRKSASYEEDGTTYFTDAADFNPSRIKKKIKKYNPDKIDNLPIIAKMLSGFVKEIDTTRPITAGLVLPSVGFATGYADALDLVGFNYRAPSYEAAHKMYPNKVIYGSENWGTLSEWLNVKDKDYMSGIFIWTGFAYKGEAGPLPKMGLEISLFDYVGNKTPRGHFFETLWGNKPKIFLGTTSAKESEFSYSNDNGWIFTKRKIPEHLWQGLRRWEWFDIYEMWKYKTNENIVVQSYTNTESAELFLNGKSLGRKQLKDFDDQIIKWMVPYQAGELKVVGYNSGKAVTQSILNTHGKLASIELNAEKQSLTADQYDTTYIHATLLDKNGNLLSDAEIDIKFTVEGNAKIAAVDNGWENNIQDVLTDHVITHKGKAALLLQAQDKASQVKVYATANGVKSKPILINLN
ncbi:sugar-binding domain-containing protein [Colwellia sp. RE-S-Sl-9]